MSALSSSSPSLARTLTLSLALTALLAAPAAVAQGRSPRAPAVLPGVSHPPGAPRGTSGRLDAPAPEAAFAPVPAGARVSFNVQDAELPEVVRAISDITGRRFVVSGRVRGVRLTIYSPARVTPDEAYQAFLAALASSGLLVVPANGCEVITEAVGAATLPLPVYRDGAAIPADASFVTRVYRLRALGPDDAVALLNQFRSRDGSVTALAATGTVVITDQGANVRRLLDLLAAVDVPADRRPALRAAGHAVK